MMLSDSSGNVVVKWDSMEILSGLTAVTFLAVVTMPPSSAGFEAIGSSLLRKDGSFNAVQRNWQSTANFRPALWATSLVEATSAQRAFTYGATHRIAVTWSTAGTIYQRIDGATSSQSGVGSSALATNSAKPFCLFNAEGFGEACWGTGLSELAVYNVILTEAELASFDKCFSPLRIRPQARIHLTRGIRSIADLKSGRTPTTTTGVTAGPHPRIF